VPLIDGGRSACRADRHSHALDLILTGAAWAGRAVRMGSSTAARTGRALEGARALPADRVVPADVHARRPQSSYRQWDLDMTSALARRPHRQATIATGETQAGAAASPPAPAARRAPADDAHESLTAAAARAG
jgi:hypothetical protein